MISKPYLCLYLYSTLMSTFWKGSYEKRTILYAFLDLHVFFTSHESVLLFSTLSEYFLCPCLLKVRDYVTSTARKQIYQSQRHWQTGLKLLEGDVTSQLARVSLKVFPLHCIRSETIQNCISLVSSAYTVYSGLLEDVSNAVQLGEDVQFPSKRLAKVFLKFAFFCDELLSSTKYAQWGSEVQSRIKQGNLSTGLSPSSTYTLLVVKYIMKAVQMDNSMPVQHGIARVLTLLGHCWGLCSICYSEGKVPMAFKQEEYRFKEYGSETEVIINNNVGQKF